MTQFRTQAYKDRVRKAIEAGYSVDEIASLKPNWDRDAIASVASDLMVRRIEKAIEAGYTVDEIAGFFPDSARKDIQTVYDRTTAPGGTTIGRAGPVHLPAQAIARGEPPIPDTSMFAEPTGEPGRWRFREVTPTEAAVEKYTGLHGRATTGQAAGLLTSAIDLVRIATLGQANIPYPQWGTPEDRLMGDIVGSAVTIPVGAGLERATIAGAGKLAARIPAAGRVARLLAGGAEGLRAAPATARATRVAEEALRVAQMSKAGQAAVSVGKFAYGIVKPTGLLPSVIAARAQERIVPEVEADLRKSWDPWVNKNVTGGLAKSTMKDLPRALMTPLGFVAFKVNLYAHPAEAVKGMADLLNPASFEKHPVQTGLMWLLIGRDLSIRAIGSVRDAKTRVILTDAVLAAERGDTVTATTRFGEGMSRIPEWRKMPKEHQQVIIDNLFRRIEELRQAKVGEPTLGAQPTETPDVPAAPAEAPVPSVTLGVEHESPTLGTITPTKIVHDSIVARTVEGTFIKVHKTRWDGVPMATTPPAEAVPAETVPADPIVEALRGGGKTIDEVAEALGLPVMELLPRLTLLELQNKVVRGLGNAFYIPGTEGMAPEIPAAVTEPAAEAVVPEISPPPPKPPTAKVAKPTRPIEDWTVTIRRQIKIGTRKTAEGVDTQVSVRGTSAQQVRLAVKRTYPTGTEIVDVRRAEPAPTAPTLATRVAETKAAQAKPAEPAPAVAEVPSAGKQAWEMTVRQYGDLQPKTPPLRDKNGVTYETDIPAWVLEHRRQVIHALSEGKPVSPEVLADYPDLAAKPIGSVTVREKDGRGAWRDPYEAPLVSVEQPRNVRGKVSTGNWVVNSKIIKQDYQGEPYIAGHTKYFYKKVDADAWIREVTSRKPAEPAPVAAEVGKPAEVGKQPLPTVLSKEQMIDRGAGGSLSHAIEVDIPLSKIEGREPTPAGDYRPGTPVNQPIEVTYDKHSDTFTLYAGNHRVRQAEVNGQSTVKAFVETEKADYPDLAALYGKVEPAPAAEVAGAGVALPESLRGAKPRYGFGSKLFTLDFASDIDRAAYIVRNASKKSKADERYMEFLRQQFPGVSDTDLRAKGLQVSGHIKRLAQGQGTSTGTIRVDRVLQSGEPPSRRKKTFEPGEIQGGGAAGGMVAIIDLTERQTRPGPPETGEEAPAPTPMRSAVKTATAIRQAVDLVTWPWEAGKKTLSPGNVSEESKTTAQVIREATGEKTREDDVAWAESKERRDAWNKVSREEVRTFIRDFESDTVPADPGLARLKADYQRRMDDCYKIIKSIKNWTPYVEQYFPRLWKDPKKARGVFAAIATKRPLAGRKGFLKHRTLPTFEDGIAAGLEPGSWNPEMLVLAHEAEVRRFAMAHAILDTLKNADLPVYVRAGGHTPAGYAKVDDSIATVFGNPDIPIKEAFDAVMMRNLDNLIDDLGVSNVRKVKIGGQRWGTSEADRVVVTKFGGPETAKTHELGHILNERYGLEDYILHKGAYKTTTTIPERQVIANEMRNLADLRYEGADPDQVPAAFKKYVRKADEKMANLVHAYVHARYKVAEVAPNTLKRFEQFIREHPELKPLRDIKPSLVVGQAEATVSAGGMVIRGYWYLPEDAARVINNYLSPGLWDKDWYRIARTVGNSLNQVQLGFSLFHAGFTTADVIVSHVGAGWIDLMDGDVAGAVKRWGLAPAAPGTNLAAGIKMRIEWSHPGTQPPDIQQVANYAAKAGAKATADPFYYAIDQGGRVDHIKRLAGALHDGDAEAIARNLPLAVIEGVAWPTMRWLVPSQKLGLFKTLLEQEFARNPNATESERVRIAQGVWDNVENRLGQLTYDNLFWNPVLKDTLMLAIRAVGWKAGTWRELGGAVQDTLSLPGRVKSRGRWKGSVSQKQGYALGLFSAVALMGAIITKILTGENPHGADFVAPRTGQKERDGTDVRVQLPTYMKDLLSAWEGPTKYIQSSLHPLLTEVIEQWNNEDWKDDPVRLSDDLFWKQVGQSIAHAVDQYVPYTVGNISRQDVPKSLKVSAFVGVTKAPRYIEDSRAVKLIKSYQGKYTVITNSEDLARERAKTELRQRIRDTKNGGEIDRLLAEAVKSRIIKQAGISQFMRYVRMHPDDRLRDEFKRLTDAQKRKVLGAATSREREVFTGAGVSQ